MAKELEQAVLHFFAHVAQERDQLANDLTLSSPVRERHALARDLARAVIDAIVPPEQEGDQGDGQTPPAEPSGGAE